MHQTVLGAFEDTGAAADAVDALQKIPDVRTDQISLVLTDATKRVKVDAEGPTRLLEGTAFGSGLGLLLGGLAALGIVAASGGSVLAAGPILAALTGMGIGAAGGGLAGGLVAIGVPEHDAIEIRQWIERGQILVSLSTTDGAQAESARRVLVALQPAALRVFATPTGDDRARELAAGRRAAVRDSVSDDG